MTTLTDICAHCGKQKKDHYVTGTKLTCTRTGEDIRYAGLKFKPVGKAHLVKTGPKQWTCYIGYIGGQHIARSGYTAIAAFNAATFAYKMWTKQQQPRAVNSGARRPKPARHPAFVGNGYYENDVFNQMYEDLAPEKGR